MGHDLTDCKKKAYRLISDTLNILLIYFLFFNPQDSFTDISCAIRYSEFPFSDLSDILKSLRVILQSVIFRNFLNHLGDLFPVLYPNHIGT